VRYPDGRVRALRQGVLPGASESGLQRGQAGWPAQPAGSRFPLDHHIQPGWAANQCAAVFRTRKAG